MELSREDSPKRKFPVIAHLTGQGYSARDCCRILDVSRAGYLIWKQRGPTPQELRRHWLTGLIREVHAASRGTYGRRRVLAELVIGRQIAVNKKLVARIMTECGLFGLPIKKVRRGPSGAVACSDLVRREFRSDQPNRLWRTDITEHSLEKARSSAAPSSTLIPAAWWGGRSTQVRPPPGHQCPGHGDHQRKTRRRGRCTFRARQPIHVLGLQPASQRSRIDALDGQGRLGYRQRDDGVILGEDADLAVGPTEVEHQASAGE